MRTRAQGFVTIRLPKSVEEKVPREAKALAFQRTEFLLARVPYKPLTDLLADAWLQGIRDAASSTDKAEEGQMGLVFKPEPLPPNWEGMSLEEKRAWYRRVRADAVALMDRQRRAFPFLWLRRPPPNLSQYQPTT
jgi:hypothetical protein